MVRLFSAFLIITFPWSNAYGQGAKDWSRDWLENKPEVLPFVESILIVTGFPKRRRPDLVPLSFSKFNRLGYFKATDVRDVRLAYALNKDLIPSLQKESKPGRALRDLFQVAKADAVVLAAKKEWKIYKSVKGKLLSVGSSPPASGKSEKDIYRWLNKLLNYDGIVLDVQNGKILVMGHPRLFYKGQQGLIVRNSERRVVLKKKKRAGAALVELVSKYKEFAVFRVVAYGKGQKRVKVGSKVLIHRK